MDVESLVWVRAAHEAIAQRAAALTADEPAAPSLLPGLARAHVGDRPAPPKWP
jgi:hypothetical protein